MAKSLEENFADWEGSVFGFGYGSGEEHVLLVLKAFFAAIGMEASLDRYDYRRLEATLTPPVAWLLINALCRADVIEYGTSPRYGWLTPQGKALAAFIEPRTAEELTCICTKHSEDYVPCYPDDCNCAPSVCEVGKKCQNPFWN